MTAFADTFFGKEFTKIEELFDADLALALKILHASIGAVYTDIKTNGAAKVEKAATDAAKAAAGKSGQAAGTAALAALVGDVTADVKDEATIAVDAGKAVLSTDSARAIATSVATAA